MSVGDVVESIQGFADGQFVADDQFRKQMALVIAILAMLLALATLGGDNAAKDAVNNNVMASDYWVYSHTQGIQATNLRLARDDLELQLLTNPVLTTEARTAILGRVDGYTAAIAKLELDPGNAHSIPEIIATAQAFEAQRDRARLRDPNFDYAQVFFQIAIVLGSVSIASAARFLRPIVFGLGLLATLLLLNGFVLVIMLPGT